jgi:hypothetical protein
MGSPQDAALLLKKETTYKTGVTPDRSFEFIGDESIDWTKGTKQGQGLRAGSRVARSARRVVPTAQGGGDFSVEAISKGMGYLWELCLGSGTSTLVSGSTYQQLFTLADTPPSATLQKQLPRVDGTIDAATFLGAMVASWEFDFPNADIAMLKMTMDAGDLTTATAAATNAYPAAAANLFQFAGGSIYSGTFTAPTTTALAIGATQLVNIRSGTLSVNNNLALDRFNFGGAGRKNKPTVGLRDIAGSLVAEYDSTTLRDAVINETPMALVLNFTGGALSTGLETLQIALPEIKLDNEIPKANGTDLITQAINFTVLDNLTAAQPIWVATRTSDAAL